ncbi:DUF444 family protein [Rugamonas sp. CCM 8940]|uniref:DUF444 family protein n=1 Tax=Rugamonas sp. CCM 8940 TaxID=2765359 RepID=UPI0018F2EDA0|nr:DUF444 family protein [Rugamonas sp. CCM 8940]MBJ7313248.1 DUF444 family protein [Rugamonas sp. CCM 8940]
MADQSPPARSWYQLFSRGARDWLRHNDKVREAVRDHLPELIAGPDLMTGAGERSVQVPVRLLEHARFRLAEPRHATAAGQGDGQPGDLLRPPRDSADDAAVASGGGEGEGAVRLLLEFAIDDIMDWLWEELKLPRLEPRRGGPLAEAELVREGWDKRGASSRLDRRRTIKEAIKRRAMQVNPLPFVNEDLRFRQLTARSRPSASAVVFFVLDVSASMGEAERTLAKTFFFFALQGLRRSYRKVETRFLAHTTRAWEFSEEDFFQVSGAGGTIASSAFRLALSLLREQYAASHYNSYLFYASDGENFTEDRAAAGAGLGELARQLNYLAYAETLPGAGRGVDTEMHRLCAELARQGLPVGSSVLSAGGDVWPALRSFLAHRPAAEDDR